jgi:hypothetical protein
MKSGIPDHLVAIVTMDATDKSKQPLIREACNAIRGLCVHDDVRKETSCAYDNGRFFVSNGQVPVALMRIAHQYADAPNLACSALMAARSLVNAEDAVRVIAQAGALALPSAILRQPDLSLSLVKAVLGLTRNLCADDARKDILVGDGTMVLILRALNNEALNKDSGLVEHGLACLAAMSLRSPFNSNRMMENGVPSIVGKCLSNHKSAAALQRQACLLVRNIAARCPEHREAWLDVGIEGQLREAGSRFREVVDEAYAALRDLGCEAQVVQVNESGSVEQAFEQFGAGRKAQFNPVFEETAELQSRMVSESRAPFRNETAYKFDDDDDVDDDDVAVAVKTTGSSNVFGIKTDSVTADHDHSHDHHHDNEGQCGCEDH